MFTVAERRDTLERAQTQLGYTVAILADANEVAEKEADSADRRSEIRTAAIQKALLQYPTASIWLESNGTVLAGAPSVGDMGSFIVADEKRETFTAHAVLPIADALANWRRSAWLRAGVLAAISIAILVMTSFLARALRQRAKSDSILKAINDSAALLMGEPDVDKALTEVLATVGPTLGITRVFLAQTISIDSEQITTSVRHEWFMPGMMPLMDRPGFQKVVMKLDSTMTTDPSKFLGIEATYSADDFPEPLRSLNLDVGIRSILNLSVIVDGMLYGTLVFTDSSPKRRQWDHAVIDTLKTLARLISTAASRTRNIEQRDKSDSVLKAINDSAALLMGEPDVDKALTEVLATVGPTLGIARVFMVEVIPVAADRVTSNVRHEWFAPGMAPLKTNPDFQEVETASSSNMDTHPSDVGREANYFADDFPEPSKSRNINAGIRSILSLAVTLDGKYFSSLIFSDSAPTRRHWEQSDIDTLKTLARLISAAATRASNIRQRAKTDSILKAINDSAALLMSEPDVEAALTAVLATVGPTIGVARVFMTTVISWASDLLTATVRHEWFSPGMTPLVDIPDYQKVDTPVFTSSELITKRGIGQETQYFWDDLPEPFKSRSMNADIRSVLSLAIIVDGKLYGNLIFADSSFERRVWDHTEIDTLRTLARLISTAAARTRNIAEREQAISGLRLRDRALEGISQGITITDDTAPGTPIIYTNPAFAALSRYTVDEVIGRGPLSFFDANAAPRIIERMAQANTARKPWRMETSLTRKDGTSFLDSMVTTMIVDQKGDITHSVTIHEDVTEARQREELLLEAQKMESVGQLTGGIAHDFNNLLTAIKSNAEDLRDDLKDNPLLQSQAEIVLEAADRGAGLVAQLMAFARKQELQPKVTDVNELLNRFTKLLRSTLPAHIDIDVRRGAHLPAVYVDPGRLETAILNLAVNARDAMPDGGTVTIETSLKNLDADYVTEHIEVQQGDYVLVAVTDTGVGMPPEVVERAFVPFFTTKEVGKGTGLGLSMVYGFVKQSGGHAMIYSEKGLGTVVKIYLPALDQAAPSGDQPTTVEKANPGTGSILLVEDDPIVRQSISGKLTRLGYKVVTTSNALEAIETLKSNSHFDLVFSDVIMPGPMNGADLVREVRRRWPRMNVLLTSGYTESTVLGKINLPTDVNLLSKPYSNADLARVIGEAIGRPLGSNAA